MYLRLYQKQRWKRYENVTYLLCHYCKTLTKNFDINYLDDNFICNQCIYSKNYIRIYDEVYETIDLKEKIIMCIGGEYVLIGDNSDSKFIEKFDKNFTNIEWYRHCFTNKSNALKKHVITFTSNMNFFKLMTRFNHYSNFIGFAYNCFYYNSDYEQSVEQITDIVTTLRIVMIKYRVPRCLRDYVVRFYL